MKRSQSSLKEVSLCCGEGRKSRGTHTEENNQIFGEGGFGVMSGW